MIDSHCHLDHEPLINNLNDVLERSKKVGIDKLLTISTNINSCLLYTSPSPRD